MLCFYVERYPTMNGIKVFVLSAFVLSFVGIVQCFAHKPIYTDNHMSTNDRRCSRGETKDVIQYEGRPSKRAVHIIQSVSKTLRKILTRSKTYAVQTRSKTYRRYEKKGDVNTALDDFYAFGLNEVHETTSMAGRVILLQGHAGPQRIRLRLDGDVFSSGRPVLEIVNRKTTSGPYIDRIV